MFDRDEKDYVLPYPFVSSNKTFCGGMFGLD